MIPLVSLCGLTFGFGLGSTLRFALAGTYDLAAVNAVCALAVAVGAWVLVYDLGTEVKRL